MHQSTGKIIYDPKRGQMKRKVDWWCVVNADREITRYYRWWVQNRYHIKLHEPAWNAHVSVLRGEKPRQHLMHLWKKYHGETIKFNYSHVIRRSGDTTGNDRPDCFWFVEVESPELTNIRKELELPYNWKLHLTIGRSYA